MKFIWTVIKSVFWYLYNVFQMVVSGILNVWEFLVEFLGPCKNSIMGRLNEQEIYRTVSLTISAGGGLYEIFLNLKTNIDKLVTDPVLASQILLIIEILQKNKIILVFMLLLFVLELGRRKYHHGE